MDHLTNQRQLDYEIRRRSRLLGLSIDQVLTGVKNIIAHSHPQFWDGNVNWITVKGEAEDLLVLAMSLERKMSSLADLYASMIPNNPEATTTPKELDNG